MTEPTGGPLPPTMLDRFLAAISIAFLIAFMGVLVVYIGETALTVITVVVLLMAIADFYLLTRRRAEPDA